MKDELIEEIRQVRENYKISFPDLNFPELRFVDLRKAHTNKVKSVLKWIKGLSETEEYKDFMYWWKQTTPDKWNYYKINFMTDLPEFKNMTAARAKFQQKIFDTTPKIVWSRKRLRNVESRD